MTNSGSTLDRVKTVLVKILGIQDRAAEIDTSTPLFGSMPELDSLAVVELAASLEEEFGFEIDDEDFTGDVFESVGTLVDFVEEHRQP
jgi:acyl carrier protein